MFVFDAGYNPIAIGHDLADINAQILCRIRDYTPRPGADAPRQWNTRHQRGRTIDSAITTKKLQPITGA